jgi:hypothetical protein
MALPARDELLVGGGVEQHRTIVATSEPDRVAVDAPFAPPPSNGQTWRIAEGARVHGSATGTPARFLWDSRDAGEGQVFLRAFARDDEAGPLAGGLAPKSVRTTLHVEPLVIQDPIELDYASAVALGISTAMGTLTSSSPLRPLATIT